MLSKNDFLQEGWRLAPKSNDDQSLVFKGVVFNEMKGVMADTSNIFVNQNQAELFRNSMYGECSGGEPLQIPSLTWEQLKSYHQKHYHPSNAIIYTFGNIEIGKQLSKVEEYIHSFSPAPSIVLNDIVPWRSPREISVTGPIDSIGDPSAQDRIAISWITKHDSILESMLMTIISDLLLDGASSPMHQALIQAKLGTDFAPTTGYSSYTKPTSFSVGLQGVKQGEVALVKETILDVLRECIKKGFSKNRITAVFHQMELGLKHRRVGFGMNVGYGLIRRHVHGGQVLQALDFEKNIEQVRRLVQNPTVLSEHMEKMFVENNHRLTFHMRPDPSFNEQMSLKEENLLNSLVLKLSAEDIGELYKQAQELELAQNTKTDTSLLPCLSLDEISRDPQNFPTRSKTLNNGMKIMIRETVTNGIIYLTLKFSLENIEPSLIPYLPIFSRAMTSLGTKHKSLSIYDEQIRLFTGGIGASPAVDPITGKPILIISATAAKANLANLMELLLETLRETNWDAILEYETALKSELTDIANSCVDSGHSFAMRRSGSCLSNSLAINELLYGVRQMEFLDQLVRQEKYLEQLDSLKQISNIIIGQLPSCLLICESDVETSVLASVNSMFSGEPSENIVASTTLECHPETYPDLHNLKNDHKLDIGVNYCSRSYQVVPCHTNTLMLHI